MGKRKAISKKTRFEVFKRDSFQCQYCGGKAPDVLLHVDHIKPVAKGGTGEMLNLITACVACNQGKSATELDDKAVVEKQRAQLEELQDRREQLRMMMEWQSGLLNLDEDKIDALEEYWGKLANGYTLNENGRKSMRSHISKFSIDEICAAMRVSANTYLEFDADGKCTMDSWELAFKKIGGIAYNKKLIEDNPDMKDLYPICNVAENKFSYFRKGWAIGLLKKAIAAGVGSHRLFEITDQATTWSQWREEIETAAGEAA